MNATPLYTRRTSCRLCDSGRVECVMQLAPSALAESYLPPERSQEAAERFPLDLFLCRSCGHVQLFDVIDPVQLFSQYVYTSLSSPGLDEHFRKYADEVVRKLGLPFNALAVDIGSNDGTLLRHFARHGMRVVGVDPACEIARQASEAGIPTMNAFMNRETACRIVAENGPVQLCTANNVFAHNDQLGDMCASIASILADDGVFVFEVSYLLDTVEGLVFDFIYHEHLCYHSVKPMQTFLKRYGLELFDVERNTNKGGSIRCFAQKRGNSRTISPNVGALLALEESSRLYDPDLYRSYMARINQLAGETLEFMQKLRARGGRIAGYGASATVTTLLHHFQIGHLLDFLVDDNPIRHGTVSPGYGIPVKSPNAIYHEMPDVVIIVAWRFAQSIINRHSDYLQRGGIFLVPMPTLQKYRRPLASANNPLRSSA